MALSLPQLPLLLPPLVPALGLGLGLLVTPPRMLLWLFLLRHLPLIHLLWAIMRLRDKRYLFHCLIPLTMLPLPTPLHLHLSWRLLPQSIIRLDFLRRSLSSTLRVCQRLSLDLRLLLSLLLRQGLRLNLCLLWGVVVRNQKT